MFPFMFAGAERERAFDALVRPVALIKKPFAFRMGALNVSVGEERGSSVPDLWLNSHQHLPTIKHERRKKGGFFLCFPSRKNPYYDTVF